MEELVNQAQKIFWTARDDDDVLFNHKVISCTDYKHWDNSACNPQDCGVCSVLAPTSTGWFSDERIFPMTNTSHMLYEKLSSFEPYKNYTKQDEVTHNAPLKLLDVISREIIYDTNGKKYFTVSHVWSSNYFGGEPFCKDNKGYPWLIRVSELLGIQYAWIDTCCINQDDIGEKQQEIGNMRKYYTNADSCAVLLSSTTAKDIGRFVEDIRLLAHKAVHNPYRRLGHVWTLASIFHSNLLTDEWFKRVWTIQEIILSRNVVVDSPCGLVDLTELLKCYHTLVYTLGKMAMCNDDMDQTRTLSYYIHSVSSYNMASVLELCVGRQATNRHDYVYGVLGLLPNIHININYKLPLEDVMVSLFREAIKNGDLSWISWLGPSFLDNHSFIPVIGSSMYVDKWNVDANRLSVTFDESMTIKSDKMDVEIIGVAEWNGAYPGIINACIVLYMLCLDKELCHGCFVTKFCKDGCCTPYAVKMTMALGCVNGNFCADCSLSDRQSDKCVEHMERLFAKQHDCCVLLMKTKQDKYLIGRTYDQLLPDNVHQQVLMFGDQEMGYYGWIMDKNHRIGIVSCHEKDFGIKCSDIRV